MRVVLILICLVVLASCYRAETLPSPENPNDDDGRSGPSIRGPGRNPAVTELQLELTESDVTALIQTALAAGGNPLMRNPQVDLQAGQVVITGEHLRRDGVGTVSGSVTLQLTVENDVLTVRIIQANVEGWDVNDAHIAQFNQRLQDALLRHAGLNQSNARYQLQSITVLEDKIKMVLVPRR
jgi:hypothetical protein